MNIDDFLVSDKPEKRQVIMPDGTEHTLYFLQPTAADIRRWLMAEKSNDENQRIYAAQKLVAACLYDPKQQRRAFDDPNHPDKYRQLNFAASENMAMAILEMAGIFQQKKT